MAAYTNLAAFYVIGMPIAILLGFKAKLYTKVGSHIIQVVSKLWKCDDRLALCVHDAGTVDRFYLWSLLPSFYSFSYHAADQLEEIRAIYQE